jgi:hypothetical protein
LATYRGVTGTECVSSGAVYIELSEEKFQLDGKTIDWMEKVSDEQYQG